MKTFPGAVWMKAKSRWDIAFEIVAGGRCVTAVVGCRLIALARAVVLAPSGLRNATGYPLRSAAGRRRASRRDGGVPMLHIGQTRNGNVQSGPLMIDDRIPNDANAREAHNQPTTDNALPPRASAAAAQYKGPDPTRIRTMFGSIARRYDRANTVMSAGVHHRWRRTAVRWSGVERGDAVLDCATGTGDLAIAFRRVAGASGRVVGTDFTPEMIELAQRKADDITFEVADVTALPFDDDFFDIASISFGIRNVGDPAKGIAEMARVVRPGGRVIVLELGQPSNRLASALYNSYRRHFLPALGGAVTGERGAYEYLESSAARFPCGDEFVAMMRGAARFTSIDVKPLTFGIAYLYRGVVG